MAMLRSLTPSARPSRKSNSIACSPMFENAQNAHETGVLLFRGFGAISTEFPKSRIRFSSGKSYFRSPRISRRRPKMRILRCQKCIFAMTQPILSIAFMISHPPRGIPHSCTSFVAKSTVRESDYHHNICPIYNLHRFDHQQAQVSSQRNCTFGNELGPF